MSNQPLFGVRVVEFAGIGPGPFACGLLADLGATVLRIERPGGGVQPLPGVERLGVRNRLIAELDVKDEVDREIVTAAVEHADVLVEGFRPGVMERLGFGPDMATERNPRLVYARISGWGQDGPYASMAGHDINYIGLSGVLDAVGDDRPLPPLNLVGDYAGGAMYAVVGILAALVGREATGRGEVIDAAMVDGSSALLDPIRDLRSAGVWSLDRSANLLDGGAPFYRTYRTLDDGYMAVGALEPAFYSAFVAGLGLEEASLPDRFDQSNWPSLREQFANRFEERSRDEWTQIFNGTDACVTPVMSMDEAPVHPHNAHRRLITEWNNEPVSEIAPRMGHQRPRYPAATPVSDTLLAFGIPDEAVRRLADAERSYWV